jgi:hypothetical protein
MRQPVNLSQRSSTGQCQQSISQRSRPAMRSISQVFGTDSIKRSVDSAKSELRDIISSCLSGRSVICYNSEMTTASACDFHRMLSEWSRNTRLDSAVRNIIISACYSSEARMGGSGILAAMMFCGMIPDSSHHKAPTDLTIEDVQRVISSWQPGGSSARIANEIFKMGAAGCPVRLREGEQFGSLVKCTAGLPQPGEIETIFAKHISENFEKNTDTCVIAVDGIVESVGQIHKVLEASTEQYVVIMARGFLPDVSNTLAVNFAQGRTKCIPFVVNQWMYDNFLELQHLGISCVSSEAGDVISNASIPNAISVSITKNQVVMLGAANKSRKIDVDLGRDLGPLRGLALDRIKLLLALVRFTIRSGFTTVMYDERTFHVPKSSYVAAHKTKTSLEENLFSLGAVIVDKKYRKKKNVTNKNKKSVRVKNMPRRY